MTRRVLRAILFAPLALMIPGLRLPAQDSANAFDAGVRAIALLTHSTATPHGGTLTMGYLTQPVAGAQWRHGLLHATGMVEQCGF